MHVYFEDNIKTSKSDAFLILSEVGRIVLHPLDYDVGVVRQNNLFIHSSNDDYLYID